MGVGMRRPVLTLALVLVAVVLAGCEQYADHVPSAADLTVIAEQVPAGPTKDAIVATAVARFEMAQAAEGTITVAQAQEQAARAELERIALVQTAEARGTVQAQQNAANATTSALSARATGQALDALATAQAQDAMATAQAQVVQATATVEARVAQATAEARRQATAEAQRRATATMQAAIDQAELTRVASDAVAAQATAQAIERQNEIAEGRQVLTTFGGWAILFLVLAGAGYVGYMTLPAIAARLGAIPRDERGDPPVLVLAARGAMGGITVMDLPKLWGGVTQIDGQVRQPQLTRPDFQDAQSKRADFVNLAKGGRPRPMVAMPRMGRMQQPPNGNGKWRVEDDEPQERALDWPRRVDLLDVFADRTPSLNHLVIGAYPQEDGQLAVVGESLHKLMHILCCGSSGWGKSTFLSSFVWQLAQCREPVGVVAIDISGSEFNLLRGWEKLQFPVARNDMDAVATLMAVAGELKRRRELYEVFPQARNLARYNRMSGETLEPWVILLDEGASLLARRDTGDVLRDAIQTSRQYGIYCLLSSVSVNHQVLATQTRDQFSTRVAFRSPKASMRVVLDETPPEEPRRPGRAWARLAGREMVQIQAPLVEERDLMAVLESGEPGGELPETVETPSREDRVRELLVQDTELTDSAVAQVVWGYQNARVTEKVREIRQEMDRQTEECV